MTQSDLMAAFERLAAQHTANLPARLAAAGIPETAWPQVEGAVAVVLAGIRLTVGRWTPRPPLQTPAEVESLLAEVADVTERRITEALCEFTDWMAKIAGASQRELMEWNRIRPARKPKLTPEQRAALTDPEPTDYDSVEYETLPDGSIRPHYHIKPEPAIVDWTRHRFAGETGDNR
jgi:hypothetical protein